MTEATQKVPLNDLHESLGARMVPFAGYSMPLQYPDGILTEHKHCRAEAGLFDVSHMGQIILRPRSGDLADAALALENLVPVDVLGLGEGRQRYAMFTNTAGGIEDDLMFANRGDHLFLVVNAACKEADEARLREHLSGACEIEVLTDRALLALQGPKAGAVLEAICPDSAAMKFMDVRDLEIAGIPCIASRSGYTGEDGFEISVPSARASDLARTLLDHPDVKPIGLGARDSLRLEAGLCLYGNDIDVTTSPVEAALTWAIQKARRADGDRAGGFPGAERILMEFSEGASRKRVGLRPEGRAPVRAEAVLYGEEQSDAPVGMVTSGVFGPTVEGPVAMGYVGAAYSTTGTQIFAEVRGKRLPVTVTAMPFVAPGYKR